MVKLLYVVLLGIFLYGFIKLELYFIAQSRRAFKELKEAYNDYKEAKNNLLADLDKARK
jgi:hypothetical protein